MSNLFRRLMPKQEDFFPLFVEHANLLKRVAEHLRTSLTSDGTGTNALDASVREGESVSQKILTEIRTSFVTPFDRTEIKHMTGSMQSLLAEIGNVATLSLSSVSEDLKGLGDLIAQCADELRKGIGFLEELDKHGDELRQMREAIATHRRYAGDICESAVKKLVEDRGAEMRGALLQIRMIDRVKGIVDRFDAVADRIDDVVLSHV